MRDIILPTETGQDASLINTDVNKAKNILEVQLGSLTYLPDFGIDLEYFLVEDTEFQNESFKSYLVQSLVNSGINVVESLAVTEDFFENFNFTVSSQSRDTEFITR